LGVEAARPGKVIFWASFCLLFYTNSPRITVTA